MSSSERGMGMRRPISKEKQEQRMALTLLLPALAFLTLLIAYPLLKVLYDSFQYSHLINKSLEGFIGFENFKKVVTDEHFGQAVKNSIIWTVFSVLGEYVIGMIAAVVLNQNFKGRAIFRTFVFIPWLVPIIVAGMTWDWMLNTNFGIINYILTSLKIVGSPIDFFGDARYAMATVIFINIWRSFPYYTISFLAAMQSIPGDLGEAAQIDGAGAFRRFFSITMPQLRSVSLVIVFIHIIWTSVNFDFIWVLTEGGPNYATETLPIMIYRYSMKLFDVGAASALSTMMFTAMAFLFVFYYRTRSKISQDMG